MERNNISLEEIARKMLNETNLPKYFWADVVSIINYVTSRVLITSIIKHNPYELYKGRNSNISNLHVFGFKCFVLNKRKYSLGKFNSKVDEGVFLGHSSSKKSYRSFNKRTLRMKELINVSFDEFNPLFVEVDVIDYACILERTSLEGDDHSKDKDQIQEEGKILNEETQVKEVNLDNQSLPKE